MRAKLWCGKVTTARWLLCAAAGELRRVDRKQHCRRGVAKINRLAQMIIEFGRYLEINQPSMPNDAKRWHQGLPVSSSRAESSANALVNRRMNKRRQMRSSPQGAQRVLQTRVAVLDGMTAGRSVFSRCLTPQFLPLSRGNSAWVFSGRGALSAVRSTGSFSSALRNVGFIDQHFKTG